MWGSLSWSICVICITALKLNPLLRNSADTVAVWLLLFQGTFSILGEQTHIKDGLSRIMVEIIKREWPQQYPDMFDEFHNLCSVGVSCVH